LASISETPSLLIGVNFIPQFTGTVKGNDFPGPEHHGIAGGRIPAFPLSFFTNTKFSKTADEDIFIGR
jgi:hypothetical protein